MNHPVRLRIQRTLYPHWGRYSGIGQYLGHLDPARYRVFEHAALDDDSAFPIANERLRDWLRRKIRRGGMAWYKLSDLAAELSIFAACVAGRVDIVHFLDGEHCGQYLPRLLAWLPRKRPRLVVSYHQPVELLPELVPPAVARRFDRVVLVAPSQASYFEAFMPAEKIVTILHGIDTGFFRPPAAPNADDGVFRCVSSGHWLRDWPVIQAVAERLKDRTDIEFHLITGRQTGLEGLPNVHFYKGIDDDELLALYQRSDALLLPLTGSTANNSVLEAMACGLPVISTALPAVKTYLGEGAGMLFSPGDVEGTLSAILQLQDDRALHASLSRASRTRAEELAWPLISQSYDALYSEIT